MFVTPDVSVDLSLCCKATRTLAGLGKNVANQWKKRELRSRISARFIFVFAFVNK